MITNKPKLIIKDIPSLDWDLSIQLVGNNEKLATFILKELITNLPQEKILINKALNAQDLPTLEELVHKLYGSCCYTGLLKLKYILKQILNKSAQKNIKELNKYIMLFNQEVAFILNSYFN